MDFAFFAFMTLCVKFIREIYCSDIYVHVSVDVTPPVVSFPHPVSRTSGNVSITISLNEQGNVRYRIQMTSVL